MAGTRDERVADLFFEDQTALGNPAEEGLVRLVSGDLKTFIAGQVKSLLTGTPVSTFVVALGDVVTAQGEIVTSG